MVLPLPKTSSTSVLLSDFRPITILSVPSKGERILYDQLVAYLESNSLLSQFQSGFRRCHSTASALVKIIYDIQLGVEASVVVLLDFSETFDSMSHDLLLRILRDLFGLSILACRLIGSFLDSQSQRVRLNGDLR
jgi:hypothetical protein